MRPSDDRDVKAFAANLPGAAFYYWLDEAGAEHIEVLNDGCAQVWSLPTPVIESAPSRLWAMVHPEDLGEMQASVQESAQKLSIWELRFRIRDEAGTEKTLLGRGTPELLDHGNVRWLTFLFDVTDQTRTETLFHRVTRQLHFVSNAIPDGFALFDPQERLVVCNRRFRDVYGLPEDLQANGLSYGEILAHATERLRIQGAEGRGDAWIEAALSNFREGDSRLEQEWDNGRWMRILDRPTEDGGRVAFRIEITESVQHKRALEEAATTDPVTGLLNRRGLSLRLADIQARLGGNDTLLVMHIDLDKFKAINDAYGHETGDVILREVARRLQARLGDDALIARAGGDEFIAVMVRDPDMGDPGAFTETLRSSMIEPIEHNAVSCRVGATLGFSEWAPGGDDGIEQTLADADTALTSGKTAGRCRTVRFSPEMRIEALHSASLAERIKRALSDGAFVPFFQPQIAFPEGKVVGLEALARWRHPDGRHDPAGSFITVANETGLVAQIDRMIYARCLDTLCALERDGFARPGVSINLSAQQLGTDGIVEVLLDGLFQRGLSPAAVNVEVLESTLLDSRAERISSNIHALAEAGFRIELDDFGTGHTALASLTTFPVNRIKIDRSLICGVDHDRKKQAVVSGLFLVCDKLGIEALAEGVETRAEFDVLREIGFRLFQGYLFSQPMSADALLSWLRSGPAFDVAGRAATPSRSVAGT